MARKQQNSMKGRILLAEDDKYISRAYREGFERAGFKVIVAYDGKEAMNKIRSEKPDLILLDLIMPVKDGFEVLRDLKKDNELKKIPIVILSNLGERYEIERALSSGAADYLVKSHFSMKEVMQKINENLSKSKASQN